MFGSALHSLVSQLGQGASLIPMLAQSLSPEVFRKISAMYGDRDQFYIVSIHLLQEY